MRRTLATMVATTVVLLSACGGDDGGGGEGGGGGGRPSAEELSEVFQKGSDVGGEQVTLDTEPADCVAQAYVDSDLSDEALRAMIDPGEYQMTDGDIEKMAAVAQDPDFAACLGMEMPELGELTESPAG